MINRDAKDETTPRRVWRGDRKIDGPWRLEGEAKFLVEGGADGGDLGKRDEGTAEE